MCCTFIHTVLAIDKVTRFLDYRKNSTTDSHHPQKSRANQTVLCYRQSIYKEPIISPLKMPLHCSPPLVEPDWTTFGLALTNWVKFFIVAETAIALIKHTAGVATRIRRTITPAKYMLVRPYITINIVSSDNLLKHKYRPAGKKKSRIWKSNMKEDHAVG